ncbi:DNA-3-methyladenine glycosylase 1 [Sesamum angolense]|uniref:DNA-3-methyladenine glycosylase 1 n=1 Tax=Sesamum angolense TaxID=2727404 RepID=A0AAE1WKW4_9LAMI|nr:DNA-3-methyladenine glycosylase 1 [Sesamum angolense]
MSGPPRVKSMNFTEPEARPVLGPGNKSRSAELRKPVLKPKSEKTQRPSDIEESKGKKSPAALESLELASEKIPSPVGFRRSGSSAASILRQRQPNLSLNASCSSDASSDSSQSRASTGRISRRSATPTPPLKRKPQCNSKGWKIENKEGNGKNVGGESESLVVDGAAVKSLSQYFNHRNVCRWCFSGGAAHYAFHEHEVCLVDPSYAVFHDEEWGVPVHDDKKLFELLSFSTALAEITWPIILSKRHIFREIINELGSFDKYIWGFVNYKPIVGNFRYPRQVPIRTSKADTISKDLVRRGFRGVGPTVVYSFMQVAGITNDHLISCFRHHDCVIAGDLKDKNEDETSKDEGKPPEDIMELELVRDIDDLSLSS